MYELLFQLFKNNPLILIRCSESLQFFSKISDNSVDKQDVTCYINFNNKLKKVSGEKAKDWFTYHSDEGDGAYYTANIVESDFDKWISNGMKD